MSDENLSNAFSELGRNLSAVLKAAWERPERKQIQQEIEDGLELLGGEVRKAVDQFGESDLGQNLKSEADRIKTKVADGDVEETVRGEVNAALRKVNEELGRLTEKLREVEAADPEPGDPAAP